MAFEDETISGMSQLDFLTGDSPKALLAQMKQLRGLVQIVSMYAYGSKHIVWFKTTHKVLKKSKKKTSKLLNKGLNNG